MRIIIICFFVAIMIIIMFITAIPGAPSVTATTAGGRALWHVPGCSSTAGASVTWHEMTAELVAGLAFLMFQSLWLEGISMNLWWTEWLAVVWWFGDWVVGFATIPNMQVQIGPLMKTANIWLDWLFSYMNFHHLESNQHAVPNSQQDFFLWPFFHLLSAPKLKLSRLLHLNIRTPRLLGCHWCTIGGRGPVAARVAKGLGCAGRGGSLKIHKLVTSWRILCIQWYYLGPAISKLQIRSWCRRRAYPCH